MRSPDGPHTAVEPVLPWPPPLAPLAEWGRTRASDALARFEARLCDTLDGMSPVRQEVRNVVADGSAKRLRPLMVFLAASFGSGTSDAVIDAAVAIELVHAASLLHDDMIDGTGVRRGSAALHVTRGPRAATLTGAHFLYTAGRLVQSLDAPSTEIYDSVRAAFSQAASDACAGQFRELLHAHDRLLDEATYFAIVEQKTARLFQVAADAGALIAGAPRAPLAAYARGFGVLYQILDDTRDIFASAADLKRPPGADVASGVITLPIILALREGGESSRTLSELLAVTGGALSDEEFARLRRALVASGATDATVAHARAIGAGALAALSTLRSPAADAMRHAVDGLVAHLDLLVASGQAEAPAVCHPR